MPMRLSANARYEVDATTIMRLVRLINRTKGLDLKSKELPDMVQLTVSEVRGHDMVVTDLDFWKPETIDLI